MSFYWDNRFISKLSKYPNVIFEVGARYGDESLKLLKYFPNSKIYSFECNPNTIHICKNKLKDYNNIFFIDKGLGHENTKLPFYSYISNNDHSDGASSLYKRIDYNTTQKMNGYVDIIKLSTFVKIHNIENIDLLCMDVQGFELNILKGAEEFIKNINYIIMEEPKQTINTKFLPKDMYSKYINAPSPFEIKKFMNNNNFIEIERIDENHIEDNVMYKNINI